MSAFALENNHFIRTGCRKNEYSPTIDVYEYHSGVKDNMELNCAATPLYKWKLLGGVGSQLNCRWFMLDVHGVKIMMEWLESLARDLTITGKDGQKFHLMVNRQGLCLLDVSGPIGPVKWLRINDRFGWSKYGVKPLCCPVWDVCDMNTGGVIVRSEEDCEDD